MGAHLKKGSGQPSVTWGDCMVAAFTWGWIDGQRKSLDDTTFLQSRIPRRARSSWSQKNVQYAERLIAQGHMQPAGLAQVTAARADGCQDAAYAGSAGMVILENFLAAQQLAPAALALYDTLQAAAAFYHLLPNHQRQEGGDARAPIYISSELTTE